MIPNLRIPILNRSCRYVSAESREMIQRSGNMGWVLIRATTLLMFQVSSAVIPLRFWILKNDFYQETAVARPNVALKVLFLKEVLAAPQMWTNLFLLKGLKALIFVQLLTGHS